ncbi:hypothetical protein NQ318_017417 [Aromia moschata]|uniref:Transposase n=1 Tax=Aromia moschata TaxID=1265417 RepID=A0AAV8Z2J7_9CUCU|nr:hypothetical protein NQ318_017417 [Aromia moschata]
MNIDIDSLFLFIYQYHGKLYNGKNQEPPAKKTVQFFKAIVSYCRTTIPISTEDFIQMQRVDFSLTQTKENDDWSSDDIKRSKKWLNEDDAASVLALHSVREAPILSLRRRAIETEIKFIREHPNFVNKIFFCDEAAFCLDDKVNRHNCCYWSIGNPHWVEEIHMQHPQKNEEYHCQILVKL